MYEPFAMIIGFKYKDITPKYRFKIKAIAYLLLRLPFDVKDLYKLFSRQ